MIDAQHRGILNSGNTVIRALLERRPPVRVQTRFAALADEIAAHMADEEFLLAEHGSPELDRHRRCHANILDRAWALQSQFGRAEVSVADLVDFITKEFVIGHLVAEDLPALQAIAA